MIWHTRCNQRKVFGYPPLGDTYVMRNVNRLKVCFGAKVARTDFCSEEGLHHQSALCEECKAKHCNVGMENQGEM